MSKQIDMDESFRDTVTTVDKAGRRIWMYPHKPTGRYYKLRSWLSYFYLFILFGLPFLKVDDHPVFLINVLERRFILFGRIFWPQDFFIFALAMVIFIVFIALFTVVFGRIFCGWACPQTVFMEMVFRKIEYWIEGDANHQKALDRSPWTTEKIFKKASKWIIFWLVSFLIANAFLAYLIGVDELEKLMKQPISQNIGTFSALVIFTSVFFFVYLWLREQVCTVICPYGRMQGVLLDRDSIIVAYDYRHGEKRGKLNKSEKRDIGHCIDCGVCVKVCPTGIDIRNGTQLECINCTACMDACNNMMRAVGMPENNIRYASENNITQGTKFSFTWRMKAYSAVMCILLVLLTWLLATRTDVGIILSRTPGQLYYELPDHTTSNLYNYKFLNKTFKQKEVTLKPENFSGTIKAMGDGHIIIPKDGYTTGTMFVYLNTDEVKLRKTMLEIGVYEGNKKIKTITTSFLGPFSGK